jgi:hypothetical protein
MAARQSAAAGRCTTFATLSNAETDAETEYDTNHMEALLARRIAVIRSTLA